MFFLKQVYCHYILCTTKLWDPNRWLLLAQQFIYNNEDDKILTTITVIWFITLAQQSINRLCIAQSNMYIYCKVTLNGTKNCSTCIARLIWLILCVRTCFCNCQHVQTHYYQQCFDIVYSPSLSKDCIQCTCMKKVNVFSLWLEFCAC